MMQTTYMDHAATSFPKPPLVGKRMKEYVDEVGANINRSVYGPAQQAGMVTLELRRLLCQLFHFDDPTHVVLTPGNTWGLNMLLHGALKQGDHCLVSSMEHNAVMRPLQQLAECGVTFDRVPCNSEGRLSPENLEAMLRPNTRLVLLAHGSNVSGTIQDAAQIGKICAAHHISFCLDAAQTAGHTPIDFQALGLSALSVPGHKGLMGPQGIGALLLRPDFAAQLKPWAAGGTGSASDLEVQPPYMPDRFEPGTPNLPGIYGWAAALSFLRDLTVAAVEAHDKELSARFLAGLEQIPGAVLLGPKGVQGRVGVFSLDFPGRDNGEVAFQLEDQFGILTRCGLHCAPSAHRTLGTFPRGTVRFSFGWFTTEEDVDRTLAAIAAVSAK